MKKSLFQNLKRPAADSLRVQATAFGAELVVCVFGAALLMAVVIANGRPVVFADSNIYVWMGRMQLRPLRYALGPMIGGPTAASNDPEVADEPPSDLSLRRTEMGARSPWFGLLLYGVSALGSLWTFAALQSLAASFAIRSLWRRTGAGALEHLALMAVLALGTTLPFFVGFAMPDLWAGVGWLALVTLMFASDRMGRARVAALFVLSVAAMSFHHSNAPVAVLAGIAALMAARFIWRAPWRRTMVGATWLIAALAGGIALEGGYAAAVKASTGQSLRSPPFVSARLLADGPGRTYLRRSCAKGAPWALCRFKALPLDDSQDILWSGDPSKGVFGRADVGERLRIDREQASFVLAVTASDPLGVLTSAILNTWKTLTSVNLEDPLRDPHFYLTDPDWRDTYVADLVHDMGPCGQNERGCRSHFDPAPLAVWHGLFYLAAFVWLAVAAFWRRAQAAITHDDLGPTVVFLLAAVLINAMVLGILSGPFARYQARIAWLLPLTALGVARIIIRQAQALRSTPRIGP